MVAGLYSPQFRSQYILLVHQCPAIKVISPNYKYDRSSGYPSTKSYSCFPCVHYSVPGQSGYFRHKTNSPHTETRYPLHHLHIVKSFQRIRFLIETGTVTIHIYTVVTERNVSNQNLCIRVRIQRTFLQHIRMQQIHLAFSRFLFPFFQPVSPEPASKSRTGTGHLPQVSYACPKSIYSFFFQAYTLYTTLFLYPTRIFEIAFLPLLINTHVGMFLFIPDPLIKFFFAAFFPSRCLSAVGSLPLWLPYARSSGFSISR